MFEISYGKPISKDYFEWKYLKNPFCLNIHPIIVAEENNKLIGASCKVFSRMMVEDSMIYAVQDCDVMVHPNFRGRGIHSELHKRIQDIYRESHYVLAYSFSNKMSIGGDIHAGNQLLYKIESHWKVLRDRSLTNYSTILYYGKQTSCLLHCYGLRLECLK